LSPRKHAARLHQRTQLALGRFRGLGIGAHLNQVRLPGGIPGQKINLVPLSRFDVADLRPPPLKL
jgi:hypothetical protein